MISTQKPYLVLPKFIRQPTWGGQYISQLKNLDSLSFLKQEKIGQSYELFSKSKLLLAITDPSNVLFIPEVGYPDKDETIVDNFHLQHNVDYINIIDLINQNPQETLGYFVFKTIKKMPLLIKLNHSYGNSFQIHIKPRICHTRWKPKAESWYYLEKGLVTLGIQKGIQIKEYKKTCLEIESSIKIYSRQIQSKELSLTDAQNKIVNLIQKLNPCQYVNQYSVEKDTVIDLSAGGVHHSWEEDKINLPLGNVLYEIQEDVMDPISTIRVFDKGKLKPDGSFREVHIHDYFNFLDTNPDHNTIDWMMHQKRQNNTIVKTKHYCLDVLEAQTKIKDSTNDSFVHLFARSGDATIESSGGCVRLKHGHSCFLPAAVNNYIIKPHSPSVILKTYISP